MSSFTRNIEVKQPDSIFRALDMTKRPKREVQLDRAKEKAVVTKTFKVYRVNA